MIKTELPPFTKGFVTYRNGLAVYGGAGVGELAQSEKDRVAKLVVHALAEDPTKTIPEDHETIAKSMTNGHAVVVFEGGDTKETHGRLVAYAKLKPYIPEGGELPFGTGDFPKLHETLEAGSMLGSYALNNGNTEGLPHGMAVVAMSRLVTVARWNAPEKTVIAVTRKQNKGAHAALHKAGGEIFAHKPTKHLQQTSDQKLRGMPVWTNMFAMHSRH